MNIRNRMFSFALLLVLPVSGLLAPAFAVAETRDVNVWWPTSGAHVANVQPFKSQVPGLDVSQYEMYWQVDGGTLNLMGSNYTDYPHKEYPVDLSGWKWKGTGPYTVTFTAKQGGAVVGQRSVTIYVDSFGAPQVPVAASVAQTSLPLAKQVPVAYAGGSVSSLYVDPNSAAAKQANAWRSVDPNAAAQMDVLAAQPTANWFGGWTSDIYSAVHSKVSAAAGAGKVPVLVAYDIPGRDCGGYSAGGNNSPEGYRAWIGSFASAIGSDKAIVILEPDALSQLSCLSERDRSVRLTLLSDAVTTLKKNSNTRVYIDAGHSGWIDAGVMAARLKSSNISSADGFAVNVSNFDRTQDSNAYGAQISANLGGKHFVVDTSRNGNGSNGEWCNPSGRSVGEKPTTQTGNGLVDAYLWVKTPGESDGSCNGGPSAGNWWPQYARELVSNAR